LRKAQEHLKQKAIKKDLESCQIFNESEHHSKKEPKCTDYSLKDYVKEKLLKNEQDFNQTRLGKLKKKVEERK
jgi:hypothetical protein